jgi:thiamine-monophosphate kinase
VVIHPETPVSEIGERGLLRHIRSRIPEGPGVVIGVGDDAAAVETGPVTLVTTDCLVEGVHFVAEWTPPRLLGRKALSVNLSDIAAMAGVPRHATVSLCLPPSTPLSFVDGLYDGLLERSAETGVSIVGGNVSLSTGMIVVDVALLGLGDRMLRRRGAEAGDTAVVTGTLGAAAEGLRLLAQGARLNAEGVLESLGVWTASAGPALSHCLRAQLDPNPPLAFARALAEHDLVNAAMDVSDGLSGDLRQLCEESDVSAWIDAQSLPVDPYVASIERARGGDATALALHGGEDYQLLFAVAPARLDGLRDVAVIWDIPLTVVGEFAPGPPALLLRKGGTLLPLAIQSHDHFRSRALRTQAVGGAEA